MKAELAAGLLLAHAALAGQWCSLYDKASLATAQPVFQQQLDDLITREIQPYLTTQQQLAFLELQLDLPLIGKNDSPLEIYAGQPGRVVLPVCSLQFVDDLAKAYAWLWTNHYSSKTIDEYVVMLRYRRPNGAYPQPLVALHIPNDWLNNAKAKEMWLKVRNSAFSFMLLHEFAHIHYKLGAGEKSNRARVEEDEEQADLFALDLMRQNAEVPLGLVLYMNAAIYFSSGEESPSTAHPITPRRLHRMAVYLNRRVADFVDGSPNRAAMADAIHAVAKLLDESAQWLSVPDHVHRWQERIR